MSTNFNRITGMATGMDTDAMVKNMVKAQRKKVDRQEKNKTLAQWRKDAYNSANKSLADFILKAKKDLGLTSSAGSASYDISYKSLDYIKKVSLSNDSIADASVKADAKVSSFSLEVKKLASGASKTVSVDSGETLGKDLQMELNVNGKKHRISLNGKDGGDVTYKQLADKINSMNIGVNATYAIDSTGKGVFSMTTVKTGPEATLSAGVYVGGNQKFNNKMLVSAKGEMAKVNFNGTELQYDSNSIEIQGVKLKLKGTTKPGEKLNVNVSNNTDEVFNRIKKFVEDYNKLVDDVGGLTNISRKKLNKRTHEYYQPLTDEEKKGLSEDELKKWEENAKTGLLHRDPAIRKIFENNRTDLYKFFINDANGNTTNPFGHLTNIGISTVKYTKGSAGGKLQIDETALRAAIDKDPEKVMELLFSEGKKAEVPTSFDGVLYKKGEVIKETRGVFSRIFDNIKSGMKEIVKTAGPGKDAELLRKVDSRIMLDFVTHGGKSGQGGVSDLDFDIMNHEKKISSLTDLLHKKEDFYYNKFARMESLVAKMQHQQQSMSAQLGRQ